ncbi:MAG: TatD family hydrolase [Candidatus Paceibacterota bacterium]
MPEFIDCHTHVNFSAFDEDRDAVIKRASDSNTWMINVGTQKDTSKSAVELAEKYEKGVYAIVGLHPIHTDKSHFDESELGEGGKAFTSRGEEFDHNYYLDLLKNPKVVALGECGLDYFHAEGESLKKQKEAFIKSIEVANEVGKPLMLHIREAYKDAYEILKSYAKVKGDVHFFAGSWEEAKMFLDLGFTISFTGVITFARNYDEVIKNTPLNMMLSETDSPYVAPSPFRGKRNEPLYVQEVVKKIAEIKGEDLEKVKKQLVENAFRVFDLK